MLLTHHLKSRGELSDWRNNALLQIGFFGAFRRSELVAMQWETRHIRPARRRNIDTSLQDRSGGGR